MCRKHRPANAHLVPEVLDHVRTHHPFKGRGSFPRSPEMPWGAKALEGGAWLGDVPPASVLPRPCSRDRSSWRGAH